MSNPKKIAIVDYGVGNLHSLHKALSIYADTYVTEDPEKLASAHAIVLPGDGAFRAGMEGLQVRELLAPLKERIRAGVPILGICLGAQILLSQGFEFGEWQGLGVIPGTVVKFPEKAGVKIPHINWSPIVKPHTETQSLLNENREGLKPRTEGDAHQKSHISPSGTGVAPKGVSWENTILEGIPSGAHVYFVHSYILHPENNAHVLAETTYGGTAFCSVVRSGRVYGCQFHPEKSGTVGLRIIENFITLI